MDYELREDQKKRKEEFARFCTQEVDPYSVAIEKRGKRARERLKATHRRLGEVGYLGLSFPEAIGGQGQDLLLQVACDEVLAKACRSTFLSAHTSALLCGKLVEQFGSPDLKESTLKGLTSGQRIASLARTETGAGSDVGGIAATVVKEGERFILNGQKDFCVNGPFADVFLVVARSEKSKGTQEGLSVFVVSSDLPGVEIKETIETIGYNGTPIAKVLFNACPLSAGFLLGEEHKGWEVVKESFQWDAMGVTSASVGIIQKALETSFGYSQERVAFGKPIGSFQEVSFKLAEIRTMLDTARLLSAKAAWLRQEADPEARVLLSCAKLYASEAASKCASYAVQIYGAHGLLKDSTAGRLYRDAKYGEIGGGTSEIHRISIAKSVLDAVE